MEVKDVLERPLSLGDIVVYAVGLGHSAPGMDVGIYLRRKKTATIQPLRFEHEIYQKIKGRKELVKPSYIKLYGYREEYRRDEGWVETSTNLSANVVIVKEEDLSQAQKEVLAFYRNEKSAHQNTIS